MSKRTASSNLYCLAKGSEIRSWQGCMLIPWEVWDRQEGKDRVQLQPVHESQHWQADGEEPQQGKTWIAATSVTQSSFFSCQRGKPIPKARAELKVAADPAPLWADGIVRVAGLLMLCSLMWLQGSSAFLRATWLFQVYGVAFLWIAADRGTWGQWEWVSCTAPHKGAQHQLASVLLDLAQGNDSSVVLFLVKMVADNQWLHSPSSSCHYVKFHE